MVAAVVVMVVMVVQLLLVVRMGGGGQQLLVVVVRRLVVGSRGGRCRCLGVLGAGAAAKRTKGLGRTISILALPLAMPSNYTNSPQT